MLIYAHYGTCLCFSKLLAASIIFQRILKYLNKMLDFFKNLDEKFSRIFSFVVSYPQASKYSVNWKSQLSLSPWKKKIKKNILKGKGQQYLFRWQKIWRRFLKLIFLAVSGTWALITKSLFTGVSFVPFCRDPGSDFYSS